MREQSYVIISFGADRVPDRTYTPREGEDVVEGRGGVSSPEADLIFANGAFVQWPEQTQY